MTDARGRGLMCAVTLASGARRDRDLDRPRQRARAAARLRHASIRFRPALTVTEQLGAGVAALDRVLSGLDR